MIPLEGFSIDDNKTNQSWSNRKSCSRRNARENVYARVTIACLLYLHVPLGGRKCGSKCLMQSPSVAMQNERHLKYMFYTQLKRSFEHFRSYVSTERTTF